MITLEKLSKGKMGRDTSSAPARVGIVMDIRHGRVYLRPVGGGNEWSAELPDVKPYSLADELGPRLAEINDRASNPTR